MDEMYKLPKMDFKKFGSPILLGLGSLFAAVLIAVVFAGISLTVYLPDQAELLVKDFLFPSNLSAQTQLPQEQQGQYVSDVGYEQSIINVVKSATPSVVSIVVSKDLPVYEQQFEKYISPFEDLFGSGLNIEIPQYVQKGTELKEVGAGSGFMVSSDGIILTNKHVVSDSNAEYTVFTNDGKEYTAKVLALDPVQDLALVKIQSDGQESFQPLSLGDSSGIQVGQTAIAIGNALGQFSDTVSVGVISGLQRNISASDQGSGATENLQGVIQTDAAINSGNSGGPLLNLKGEVIGVNTAVAQGAQSIGFATPINFAKRGLQQFKDTNKISYPFLGVRYVMADTRVQKQYGLPVDYGAYVLKGTGGEPAVEAGSAAQEAGIKEEDVILELNGEKITEKNSLSGIILKFNPGDTVNLKVLRNGQEVNLQAKLGERTS